MEGTVERHIGKLDGEGKIKLVEQFRRGVYFEAKEEILEIYAAGYARHGREKRAMPPVYKLDKENRVKVPEIYIMKFPWLRGEFQVLQWPLCCKLSPLRRRSHDAKR